MPKHSIVIAAFAVGIVLAPLVHGQSPPPPRPQPIAKSLYELEAWLELARRHAPGKLDASVTQERSIGVEAHFALAIDFAALTQFIKDPGLNRVEKAGRRYSVADQEFLYRIARSERAAGTTDSLLRQIAMLESDDLMLTGGERYVIVPPLSSLPQDMVLSQDGVTFQAVTTPPNWQIGRLAIGAMSDDPNTRAWARRWYEATTAFLFSTRVLAALPKHLAQRRLVLPEDAGAWFDEGCLFEYLAGARYQHAMVDGQRRRLGIPPHERGESLAQARRMFEEALQRAPRHPEARVRLARVKWAQGDARSAVKELSAVLPDLNADPVLRYLCYLFLGAAHASAGNDAAAITAHREAINLYPRAMSPRVPLARLEPPHGAGVDPLEEFLHEERRSSEDPWLSYHTGPARRSETLSAELWRLSSIR